MSGSWRTPEHTIIFEFIRSFPAERGIDFLRLDVLLFMPDEGSLVLLQKRNGGIRRREIAENDFLAATSFLARMSRGIVLRDILVDDEDGKKVPLRESRSDGASDTGRSGNRRLRRGEDKAPAARPSSVSRPILARSRAEAIRMLLRDAAADERGSR